MSKEDSIFQSGHKKKRNSNSNQKNAVKRKERKKKAEERFSKYNFLAEKIEKKWENHKLGGYFVLFAIWPMILVFFFEVLNNRSFFGAVNFVTNYTWAFLCNALIVSASFSIALLIRKRLVFVFAMSVFWTFCAFTNFVLLCNRVTPLTGNDFALITDLFGVVFKYLSLPETIGLLALIAGIIIFIIVLFLKAPAVKKQVHYLKSALAIIFVFVIMFGSIALGRTTGSIESQFHELSASYKRNGFLYCFINSLTDIGVEKPDDYSADSIETLVEEATEDSSDDQEEADVKDANVIIVQLESFFDVNRIKDVEYSTNPIPNFTKLTESKKTGSGYFNVPVIGAGTVNSEFEVLTGMNIDDFGAGEYPYKTILKKTTCESLAYDLKANGITTHAIHNHLGTFYGRNNIYKNLGFDTFTSVEYMWPHAYTGMGWAKDNVLTEEIQKALESTEGKDLVYTVSVQGHGKYPSDESIPYAHYVEVTSDTLDEASLNQISYYVNQIYEMDEFIGTLMDYVKTLDEDTIVVFYGDHMPSLNLEDESLTDGTIYQTEYVIWNNMGLKFGKDELEAYQLSSKIMQSLNIDDGVINSYHQTSEKKISEDEMTTDEYLTGLKSLEYDILYGDKVCYNGENPYLASDMTMGIYPIEITKVTNSDEGNVIIKGKNFTRYSTVYINEEEQETYYYGPDKLMVKDITLKPGDAVEVWQRSLSSTDPYIFEADKVGQTDEETTEAETTTAAKTSEKTKKSKSSSTKTSTKKASSSDSKN